MTGPAATGRRGRNVPADRTGGKRQEAPANRPARPASGRGRVRSSATPEGTTRRLPGLALSLQFADPSPRAHLPRHRVRRWIRAALASDAEITVRVVGAEEGQALNRDFRGRNYATNVLTFDYVHEPIVVADLVLCAPVVEREARETGVPLDAHYAHLVVHGTLHAQGWDHENEADARAMEAREAEVLAVVGYPDPYRRVSPAAGPGGPRRARSTSARRLRRHA